MHMFLAYNCVFANLSLFVPVIVSIESLGVSIRGALRVGRQDNALLWGFVMAITLLELVCNACVFVLSLPLLEIIRRSAKFHPNLLNILLATIAQVYVHIVCRTILLFYEFHVIEIQASFIKDLGLLAFALMRLQSMLFATIITPAIGIERLCAEFYVHDYEVNHRIHLSMVIISVMVLLCLLTACVVIYYAARKVVQTIIFTTILAVCFNVFSLLATVHVRKRNLHMVQEVKVPTIEKNVYSLSKKFQILENQRGASLLLNTLVKTNVLSIVQLCEICSIFACFDLYSAEAQPFLAFLELSTAGYCGCFLLNILMVVKTWRSELIQYWTSRLMLVEGASLPIVVAPATNYDRQTEEYFHYYRQNW